MPDTSLFLISRLLGEDAPSFGPSLEAACRGGSVAACLLRLAPADERTLANRVKALAPLAQSAGAAVMVELAGTDEPAGIVARAGADGLHAGAADDWAALRGSLKDGRSLGIGGLRTRDDAMRAGETGADYLLFGEPRPDGWVPPLEDVVDRVGWWAEIFETPCVAYAPRFVDIPVLAATGAEFVALGDAVWDHPEGPEAAVAAAHAALRRREPAA